MAKRKSFTGEDSPARQFFSGATEPEPNTEQEPRTEPKPVAAATMGTGAQKGVPAGYKRNPEYIECRTKRVQLVIQPSLYEAAKAVAAEAGISLNEFFNRAVAKAVEMKQ